MAKHLQNKMSSRKCHRCSKPIKQNVVDRCPDRQLFTCYNCMRKFEAGRGHYINVKPRMKRLNAEMPVKSYYVKGYKIS